MDLTIRDERVFSIIHDDLQGRGIVVPDIEVAHLRAVGRFFVTKDHEFDRVVELTFQNLFTLYPNSAGMFTGNIDAHRCIFTNILRKMIELTRSCHLWPVSVQTGNALLPGLDSIRARHQVIGVGKMHFNFMKTALLQALERLYPDQFTGNIRMGFVFVYDVLAKSLCELPAAPSDLAPLSKFADTQPSAAPHGITLSDIFGGSPHA
jgi:hemoglobin-like flavoprotein